MTIKINGTEIHLLPQKAVYIPEQKILVIADMHLGKLAHFRRKGIFAPIRRINEDLENLELLLDEYKPIEVVFLGDLFHSEVNSEYDDLFTKVIQFPHIHFILTKGNHDIIPYETFQDAQISVIQEKDLGNGIVLRHQLPQSPRENVFYLVGHIHPGCTIQGKGRQIYRFPCFHYSDHVLTLPAFGKHTGLFIPDFLPNDSIYAVMNEEVIRVVISSF